MKRLTLIRAHRLEFADLDWAEAPARLAFETGTEGDRLRRYDLSRDRELIRAIGKFVDVRKASIGGTFDLLDFDLDELREFDEPPDPNASTHADPMGDSSESVDGQAEVRGSANDENIVCPRPDLAESVSGPLFVDRCEDENPVQPGAPSAIVLEDAGDKVQSEVAPTTVAGVCDPGVLTIPAYVTAACDPDVPGTAGLAEAGYSAGTVAAQTEKSECYPKTGDVEIGPESQNSIAASPSSDDGCDDDQILRNEPIEVVRGSLSVVRGGANTKEI